MTKIPMLLLVVCISCTTSCDTLEKNTPGELTGELTLVGLQLNNSLDRTVYVFPVGSNTAHLIDWAPGIHEQGAVRGQSSRTFGYDQLNYVLGEEDLIVYWWPAVFRDGNLVPGEVKQFVLPR